MIEKGVVINAPVEKVFEILNTPERVPEYQEGVVRVSDIVQTGKRAGDTAKATYMALGISFSGNVQVLEWEKNRKIVLRFESPALTGTGTDLVEPQGSGTKLTQRWDYEVKHGFLGKVVNTLLLAEAEV